MRAWQPTYRCPANKRDQAPWCSALPCHGHPATRDQVLIARVLALLAGVDDWWGRDVPQQSYLVDARSALFEIGYIKSRKKVSR